MTDMRSQMRHRDKEMVPRILVQGMFALMFAAVALVAFDQWSGRPIEGVVAETPILRERTITLTGNRQGVYLVTDENGNQIASSEDHLAGFIGVMGRVIDFKRRVARVTGNPPVRVVLREDGHVDIIDDTTGMVTELIGYGADNIAAFAQFVN